MAENEVVVVVVPGCGEGCCVPPWAWGGKGGGRGGFISGAEVARVVAATKSVADTRVGGTIWGGRCCLSQQPSETQAAAPPRKIRDKEAPGRVAEALLGASAKFMFHGTNL